MNYPKTKKPWVSFFAETALVHPKLTQKSYILSKGFRLGRSDPTSQKENTRGFIFFRFFRDLCAWFSLVLNSLVNERTILTLGFYVQKLYCLTVFSEQPDIRIVKEQQGLLLGDNALYKKGKRIHRSDI